MKKKYSITSRNMPAFQYLLFGFSTPLLTFSYSFFVAYLYGAELRGELAIFFAFFNILTSLLAGSESGLIKIQASRGNSISRDHRILKIVFRNSFISIVIVSIFFMLNKISIINALYIALSSGLFSGLIIKNYQLLAKNLKYQALVCVNGVWILNLCVLIIIAMLNFIQITVDALIGFFTLSTITISLLQFVFLRDAYGQDLTVPFRQLSVKHNLLLTANSATSILQLNGLILLLLPFSELQSLGLIALALSFLNGAFSVANGLLHGKILMRGEIKTKNVIILWATLLLLTTSVSMFAKKFLDSNFDQIELAIAALIPYFSTIYLLEIQISKHYDSDRHKVYIKLKFFTTFIFFFSSWLMFLKFKDFSLSLLFSVGLLYFLASSLCLFGIHRYSLKLAARKFL